MADIWLGRFERWLEKFFNAKGGGVIFDVNPSMQSMVPLLVGNEDRYLQGWNRFWQLGNISANAATVGGSQLRNPSGSNAIVVVEKLMLGNQGTSTTTVTRFNLSAGATTTDLTGSSSTGVNQDTRGNPNSVAILSVQNNPSPGNLTTIVNQFTSTSVAGDLILTENQEMIILPGQGLRVVSQTANEAEFNHWTWRERPLESSELT